MSGHFSFRISISARAAARLTSFSTFSRIYEADTIYLVGDVIDGWQLKSAWYWPQSHNDVVQKLLRKARKGTG